MRTPLPKQIATWIVAILAASNWTAAHAGSFSVSPVRIFMQSRERATAITVINEGDTPLVMQVELYQWNQKADGSDDLTPTDDLVMAPPVLKLAPHARQVVRLANLKPAPAGAQQSYRMVLRELPEAAVPQPGIQIQVALAFSLPVFITPPTAKRDLVCTADRSGARSVTALCSNQGQAYAQPVTMTLTLPGGATVATREISTGYLLPNISRNFELTRSDGAIPGGALKLLVTEDDGSQRAFDVRLSD